MPEFDNNWYPYHDLVDIDLPRWRRRFHLSLSSWSCPPFAQPACARVVPDAARMACAGERPFETWLGKESGLLSCKSSRIVWCSDNRNHSYGRIPTLSADLWESRLLQTQNANVNWAKTEWRKRAMLLCYLWRWGNPIDAGHEDSSQRPIPTVIGVARRSCREFYKSLTTTSRPWWCLLSSCHLFFLSIPLFKGTRFRNVPHLAVKLVHVERLVAPPLKSPKKAWIRSSWYLDSVLLKQGKTCLLCKQKNKHFPAKKKLSFLSTTQSLLCAQLAGACWLKGPEGERRWVSSVVIGVCMMETDILAYGWLITRR